jgi:hypothetical protein
LVAELHADACTFLCAAVVVVTGAPSVCLARHRTSACRCVLRSGPSESKGEQH